MTQPTRSEMIARNLRVSRAFSPAASALNDRIQEALADSADLDPAEQARLLAALVAQIGGKLAQLHG
jgi:hypothetical protein